ncbi:MAG: hypothetical protein SVR94_02670, partial [Pseudomonadota bacterium]|nr:hypothetical protein [Pseudomonadota bacterium]
SSHEDASSLAAPDDTPVENVRSAGAAGPSRVRARTFAPSDDDNNYIVKQVKINFFNYII